tara:strand:+ start:532 stop:978 length:447 start_codon:yes stop_codon:yes gene_type:complete
MADGINVDGIQALNKKLGRVASFKYLVPAIEEEANIIIRRAATYPQAKKISRKGSKYKRTGLFGASWSHRVKQKQTGIDALVQNTARRKGVRYGIYVMGPEGPDKGKGRQQAWMHKGIWKTLDSIVEKRRPMIMRKIQRKINSELRKG